MNTDLAVLRRRVHQASSYLRWARRFGSFGLGTRLGRRLSARGLDQVHLGARVLLADFWRLETFSTRDRPKAARIEIGDRTSAEVGLHVAAANEVIIEADCLIASWVFITDHQHAMDGREPPRHAPLAVGGAVRIGRGSWLGERSVIMPGVSLGPGCVVGANAVVTQSFPPGSVVAGVPARLLRVRPDFA